MLICLCTSYKLSADARRKTGLLFFLCKQDEEPGRAWAVNKSEPNMQVDVICSLENQIFSVAFPPAVSSLLASKFKSSSACVERGSCSSWNDKRMAFSMRPMCCLYVSGL